MAVSETIDRPPSVLRGAGRPLREASTTASAVDREPWQTRVRQGILRHSQRDALLVALAFLHGFLLLQMPSAVLLGLGLWWNANTISHNFIHLPFFRSRKLNAVFSWYLSVVLGIPQTLWRDRHLAHHAGKPFRLHISRPLIIESGLILLLWSLLLLLAPRFFLLAYVPGCILGLGLCQAQGFFEHSRGTTSHYGTVYNRLCFNDGYHVEHHARPATHWTQLPSIRSTAQGKASRWPSLLRWMDLLNLENLERLVLRSQILQSFVLRHHEQAFRLLLPQLRHVTSVAIVGGGLFPRTALILQRLLPQARLQIIDVNAENLKQARIFLNDPVEFRNAFYDNSSFATQDLLIIPLAYIGDRANLYRKPPAPLVLVHDWIWRRRGESVIVSWTLLKRLNLLRQ